MTKEQFDYKLKALEIRQTELEAELDKIIALIDSGETYDKDRVRQWYQDTITNLRQLREETRQLYKDYRNLN